MASMTMETILKAATFMRDAGGNMRFAFKSDDGRWGYLADLSGLVMDLTEKRQVESIRYAAYHREGDGFVLQGYKGRMNIDKSLAGMRQNLSPELLEVDSEARAGAILSAFVHNVIALEKPAAEITIGIEDGREKSAMGRLNFQAANFLENGEFKPWPKILTDEVMEEIFFSDTNDTEEVQFIVAMTPHIVGICGIADFPEVVVRVRHDDNLPAERQLELIRPQYYLDDLNVSLSLAGLTIENGLVKLPDGRMVDKINTLHCIWNLAVQDEHAELLASESMDVEDYDLQGSAREIGIKAQEMILNHARQIGQEMREGPAA